MRSKLIVFLLCSVLFGIKTNTGYNQELNAQVEVIHTRVTGVDRVIFEKLKGSVTEFLNNRKWTNDYFAPNEKINCNFFINITKVVGTVQDNTFEATLTVQASRPVYNASYSTQTFNYLDRNVVFKYMPDQTLNFDENRVAGNDPMMANLPAILAFYVNMVLGFDYESFAPNGGETYFKKAQHIVFNAPENGSQINGWTNSGGQRNNRYWIADQLMNGRLRDLRTFWYDYHINGLDKMGMDAQVSCDVIYSHFDKMKKLNKENPSSVFFALIFNAKSQEFVNILSMFDKSYKQEAVNTLSELDPVNSAKYRNAK